MVRSVSCDSNLEVYLNKLGKNNKTAIGLVIGQPSLTGRDYVIHLAKTNIFDQNEESEAQVINNVGEIKNNVVAEHALNAIRMIGGSFQILGLFVVSETPIFNDNSTTQKLKTIILDIKSTLNSNGLLYANTDEYDDGDKLILNYTSQSSHYSCKTISSDPAKAVSLKAVDFKFLDKPVEWQAFESYYEIDAVFPLANSSNHFDTEKCVMGTIDLINENLGKSIVFFDGEPCEKDTILEKFNKDRQLKGDESVNVTFYSYIPDSKMPEDTKITQREGLIHYSGIINSRIFGMSKNSLGEIEKLMKNDIIRSLTTRLQIYYDALLANDDGGNLGEHEANLNNTVPPRRVFYPIHHGRIMFNDYLFTNEFEDTTVKQVKDILDVDIKQSEVIKKAEVFVEPTADIDGANESTFSATSDDILSPKDKNKLMLIIGVAAAFLVLIIAIILHFVLN